MTTPLSPTADSARSNDMRCAAREEAGPSRSDVLLRWFGPRRDREAVRAQQPTDLGFTLAAAAAYWVPR
ncbi:hypothetical protein [Streptomyces sp. NPDC001750]|uniref:hypothetical protein n=1 Tax=Streptomyces sp. NPDC001750 TaxID=3364607 RepID=UPI0036BFB5CD